MKLLLGFVCCFSVLISLAQSKREWGFEYRQKIGFLAAHRGVMGHLPQGQAIAGEFSYFIHTKGKKQWHEPCNYPTIGATLFAGSVGNNEILGKFIGLYGFVEFPFINQKHFEFSGKLAAGLGHGSKVFDQETNPKNVAMSTHFNAQICLGLKTSYKFKRNKITLGLDMTHFSNGAFKVPNLGINLPYVSLGYGRTIKTTQCDSLVQPNHLIFRKWLIGTTFIASAKEIFPTDGKKYPVFGLSTSFRYFTKPKVGLECSFDIISKQAIMGYRKEISKTQWDILQLGIYTGYLLPLDRFHFVLGMGIYVKDKYQPEDFLYHRVGFRYYFDNGLNAQVVLKSHWARADYVEWGIGYTFNYHKK